MKNVNLSQYDSTHPISWMDAIMHDGHVKGTAKLVLSDEKTGKVEQIEHDNVVTDAVKNIFKYNYNMAGSLPDLLPLDKLFGGVLLFRNQVAEPSAQMLYPWNENENPMTACAGDEGHNTRNPYRGNPNAIASEISADGTSKKMVWEWNTSQGNGFIGSISLTSAKCGNMGLKPFDYPHSWLEMEVSNKDSRYNWLTETVPDTNMNSWTLAQRDMFPQIVESELTGERGLTIGIQHRTGDEPNVWTFFERKVEHPWLKVPFEATQNEWVFREERICKVTIPNYPSDSSRSMVFIQTSDDYYYLIAMCCISDLKIFVAKIDRSNMTLVESRTDIFNDNNNDKYCFINSYPSCVLTGGNTWQFYHVAVNSFYLDENGWIYATAKSVSGSTVVCNTAKYKLDGDGKGAYVYVGETTRTRTNTPPSYNSGTDLQRSSRFISGRNIVGQIETDRCGFYNGDMWYDTAYPLSPRYVAGGIRQVLIPTSAPFSYPAIGYTICHSGTSDRPHCTGFAYSNLYLATVNSLQEQVEKTSAMGMRVEYTLSIVS